MGHKIKFAMDRGRTAERICGPRVKTKNGSLAKRVVKITLKALPPREVWGHVTRENVKNQGC